MRLALSPALRLAVPSILGTASAFLTTLSAARRRERFSDSDLVLHALEHAWSDGCFSGCL